MLYTERRFVTYFSLTKYSELKPCDKCQQLNSFCKKIQIFPEDRGKHLLRTSAYTRLNCSLLLRLLYFQCFRHGMPLHVSPTPMVTISNLFDDLKTRAFIPASKRIEVPRCRSPTVRQDKNS